MSYLQILRGAGIILKSTQLFVLFSPRFPLQNYNFNTKKEFLFFFLRLQPAVKLAKIYIS